jgi:hypothetical protein
MSRRINAPYADKILDDGITIEYEGHDEQRTSYEMNPKKYDQPRVTKNGTPTQNGKFATAVELYKQGEAVEVVKVYEKILSGVWSLKGYFDLIDYRYVHNGMRSVFVFVLKLSISQGVENRQQYDLGHTRLIPSDIKKEVWQRDHGKCVLCGSVRNLHFDHDLPYSKGGTSIVTKNIRLLCAKCNLSKSNKIE